MLSHELTKWVNCVSTKNSFRLNSTDLLVLLTQFVIGLSQLEILTSTNLGSIFLLVCYSFQGCIRRLKSRFPWKISKHAEDMAPNSGILFDLVHFWTFHICLHLIQKKLTCHLLFCSTLKNGELFIRVLIQSEFGWWEFSYSAKSFEKDVTDNRCKAPPGVGAWEIHHGHYPKPSCTGEVFFFFNISFIHSILLWLLFPVLI